MDDITLTLPDEAATIAAGQCLAQGLLPGISIWLQGDLGAGKTTLVRGVLRGLGFEGKVKSPTYTLVEPYVVSGLYLYHFDLYRFNDVDEWEASGFREYFNSNTVCLVEWPEKAEGLLPQPDLELTLSLPDSGGRRLDIKAYGAQGSACLERF